MNYQNWGEFNPIYKQASDFILENKLKTVKDNSKNVTYQYLQENQFSNNNGGVISKLDFGYFKPHIFSKLNEIYQDARYNTLKEDGYKLLNVLTNLNPKIQNVYLLENPENGINILSEIESKQYNIDILNNDEANLVYYYINKDYQITKNKAVETFAKKQSEFYTQQYEQRGFVPSSIDMKGNVKTNSQNLMNNTGMYALFKMANYKNADKLWHSEFINNIEYDPSLKDFTTFGKNLPINEIYWGSMTLADEPN
jgi:pyridoxine/pyridoxamine 5'-phosphate oxidase